MKRLSSPWVFHTANGLMEVNTVMDAYIAQLEECDAIEFVILEDAPPLLSLGQL